MPTSKPPDPAEFRQRMIELVAAGRSPAERSRESGGTAQIVAHWIDQAAIDRGKSLPGKGGSSRRRARSWRAFTARTARSRSRGKSS